MYKHTHQHEFEEGNVFGESRAHGRYEECRKDFGQKI
jgi:hypothetical protein